MKVLYSWLCDWLDEKPDFDTILNNLVKLGFSIDEINYTGSDTEGVVTAKVLKKERHPNADRLSVCEVSDGSEVYRVVCGAKNVDAGQIVPFAKVGARLGREVLKKVKIRGVESNGMICSAKEIGVGDDCDGIMVLDERTPIGIDVKEIFKPDYVFEVEITPNLGYCLSHYALSRELSIFFGYKLKEIKPFSFDRINGNYNFNIEIKTGNCLRYAGIIIKGIENKKTPLYISQRLKKIGLNPKNNLLVDVSNYVMFDIGQPTHCFDLSNIDDSIIVRMAEKGEKIKALDLNEYELSDEVMVIADNKKPLAVAGVIGGYYSSINDNTRDILIEIANFNPSSVRKASKILNVKTDSSYRFERGVDINLVDFAAYRMIELIKSLNPSSDILYYGDVKNFTVERRAIDVDVERIKSIIGMEIDKKKVDEILERMDRDYDGKKFNVPSYRMDIENLWDIAEEVAKFNGYDNISSRTTMPVERVREDKYHILKGRILNRLKVFGFNEVINYDLVSEKEIVKSGFSIDNAIKLINPLSKEYEYLRPSMLMSLLKNLRYNINRGVKSIKLVEFGSIFRKENAKPYENRRLSGLLGGMIDESEWWMEKEREIDFFYTKTSLNYMLSDFNEIKFGDKADERHIIKDLSINIYLANKRAGYFGLLNPDLLDSFDVKLKNVFYFDIDLDLLISSFKIEFHSLIKKPVPLSPFQYGVRDLSFIVDKKYSYDEIYRSFNKVEDLFEARLIDVYEGEKIETGKRSLTFRFIFSSMKKTFTDEELNSKIENIVKDLNKTFGAKLR